MNAPERARREGDQALPGEGTGDVLLELAQALPARLRERREIGIRRYGKPLQRHNGRDAGRDATEELLDALAYVEQLRGEHADLKVRLAAAEAAKAHAYTRIIALEADRDALAVRVEALLALDDQRSKAG